MSRPGGATSGDPDEALIESIRTAAHAAVDAGDGAAAAALTRLLGQRQGPRATVTSLDEARRRRRRRRGGES